MKSFSKSLVRNSIGLTFVIFFAITVSFNLITNDFISTEAYEELRRSVQDINDLSETDSSDRFVFRGITPPMPPDVPASIQEMENILYMVRQFRTLRQLMTSTDGIIIDENNEIVSPALNQLSYAVAEEIFYLTNFYLANKNYFENEAMVRVLTLNNVYYLMAIEFPLSYDLTFSVLLYTDITSAIMFMRSVNQALRIFLILSGVASVFMSFLLSSQVNKAMTRLCKYAEVVGLGNFTEKVESFKYKEFNELAQDLNNMSHMLNTYENNQKKFFQNVSHELRTPLMSIQGYAEGIFEDVINKKEASEIIISESGRMERMISQLLYISRMDGGLDTYELTTANLTNILNESIWRVKVLADKDDKEIIFDSVEKDIEIKTDEDKLQRVFDNILTNCIRHAKNKIVVSCENNNGNIKITISDNGNGINDDDLPHIFERFYKGKNGNSGLGLAICKEIIEKLGGDIKAESDKTGAIFIITLPQFCHKVAAVFR